MNNDIINSLNVERSQASKSHIMVIGVGGGGGNAVNYMRKLSIEDVDYMVCNTDRQALAISPVELKVRLGEDGSGAGNDPNEGRRAAIASLDIIKQTFENYSTKMVFIAAAMGGGTGTGASPVIAKAAREMGILTVAIVTTPVRKEGPLRFQQALEGIEELRKTVDSMLVIDSDHIAKLAINMKFNDAMSLPDKVLASAVKGIAEIITIESSRTNIDFADVARVMRNSGRTHMGVGRASGENRAEKAAQIALNSPLLDQNAIRGARSILVNFSCSDSNNVMYQELITILEVIQAAAKYRDEKGVEQNADIIWGNSDKPDLNDDLEVVIVATNFAEVSTKTTTEEKKVESLDSPKQTSQKVDDDGEDTIEIVAEKIDDQTNSTDIWDDIKRFAKKFIDTLENLDKQNPDTEFD